MKSDANRRERWRRARRGVSDIVAALLLTAMGVVLAAVLYILIAGLLHGTNALPIGSAFAAGNPQLGNTLGTGGTSTCAGGTTIPGPAIKAGDYVYTLSVAASTVHLGDILLQVHNASGDLALSMVGFYVLNPQDLVVACAGTSAAPAEGTMSATLPFTYPAAGGASGGTPLGSNDTILLEMGSINPSEQGFIFTALGQGPFTGVTAPLVLQ